MASCSGEPADIVVITLDFPPFSTGSSSLTYKLHNTSLSQARWLSNRSKLNKDFIPIEFIHDREYISRNIEVYPETFEYAASEIQSDRQFIMDAIVGNNFCISHNILDFMDSSLKQDCNFVMQMVEKNSYILGHARANGKRYIYNLYRNTVYGTESTNQQNQEDESKERALELMEKYCTQYVKLSEALKNDIDICLTCLRNNGFYYVFMQHARNRQNKELIERAVREVSELTFFYADDNLKKDVEFVTHLIHIDPHVLLFADKELRRNKTIVLEAVKLNMETLNYASGKLLKDEEFLNQAKSIGSTNPNNKSYEQVIVNFAKNCDKALASIPRAMKKNKGLMVKVMQVSPASALTFIDQSLVQNKEFILDCINSMERDALKSLELYVPRGMLHDPELATALVIQSPDLFHRMMHLPCIPQNRELVLKVIKKCPRNYEYISEEFKNDKEITWEAVKQSYHYLAHASITIRMDKEFVLQCILLNTETIKCTDLQYDVEFVLRAVKLNGTVLKYCGNLSKEVEVEAVKQNGLYRPKRSFFERFDDLLKIRMEHEYPCLHIPGI